MTQYTFTVQPSEHSPSKPGKVQCTRVRYGGEVDYHC